MIALLLLLLLRADWTTVVKDVEPHIVRIEAMNVQREVHTCTGTVFMIAKTRGFILTAAHCVPYGLEGDFAMTANGRDAHLIKINRLKDLAVLSFLVKGETPIDIAMATPPKGSELAVVGYGADGPGLMEQFGHLSGIGERLWLDATLLYGDSGGPVVDSNGRMVAVNSQVYQNGAMHMGIVVPIEQVQDFLLDLLSK